MKPSNISRKEDLEGIRLPAEQLLILVQLCTTQLSGIKFMYLQPRLVVIMSEGYNFSFWGGRNFLELYFKQAAVDAITRNLALEWGADYDIRVNGIAPGPIQDTPGLSKLAPEEINSKVRDDMPLYRIGEKWDIAMAALYLASDAGVPHFNHAIFLFFFLHYFYGI